MYENSSSPENVAHITLVKNRTHSFNGFRGGLKTILWQRGGVGMLDNFLPTKYRGYRLYRWGGGLNFEIVHGPSPLIHP